MKLKVSSVLLIVTALILGCMGGPDCEDRLEFSGQSIGEINISQSQDGEPIREIIESIFYIRFVPEETEISSLVGCARSITDISYSFFPKANAASCIETKYSETVTAINITSDSDFDEMYPAGDSLNDIFAVSFYYESIEQSLYGSPLFVSGFSLSMRSLPTLDKIHNFQFDLSLDSGKIFVVVLEDVAFE